MTDDTPRHLPPEALEEWMATILAAMELDEDVDIAALLDLTRDVAHNVARPAAPLTTFVLGLALGRKTTAGEASGELNHLCEELRTIADAQDGLSPDD
ncbi:MAG: DUF6457 domain-containing protein [Solirubrobacterales bacterium]